MIFTFWIFWNGYCKRRTETWIKKELTVSTNLPERQELTPEEKKEQHKLRKEFIASVRMNLRSQLDNINIQEKDGSITNLGEKYGSKESH